MVNMAQPIDNLEMNGPFRLDVFYHGRRWQRWETPCDSVLRELVISLSIEVITNHYPMIKRLAEEKLGLMVGDGHNQIRCLLIRP